MNTKVRTALQTMKTPLKHEQEEKMEKQYSNRSMDTDRATTSRRKSSRDMKIELLLEVDKLKKKLRHEENVHRALERAFTRPLGALPRLPPYLPPKTLELLAEVAVLEEEVARLEEQIVNFRQSLGQEAVKRNMDNTTDSSKNCQPKSLLHAEGNSTTSTTRVISTRIIDPSSSTQLCSTPALDRCGSKRYVIEKQCGQKSDSNSSSSEEGRGKENKLCANSRKNIKQSPDEPISRIRTPVKKPSTELRPIDKHLKPRKLECEERVVNHEGGQESLVNRDPRASEGESSGPNKISEDILNCLSTIFIRMRTHRNRGMESELSTSLSKLGPDQNCEESDFRDPYGICKEFGKRDIGLYKSLVAIEAITIDTSRRTSSFFLITRLKLLLQKLASANLQGLTHQQKLAFWINIYNSCMMNAFLEHGIPDTPQMIIALMQKAMISVSGHSLNAITIEHFILRLPFHLKYTCSKGSKNDELAVRSVFGLEWSEPLVTFALSCGSWSSPAVRVYTASQVEKELEAAKGDYLQAAVGFSKMKFAVPKLLDWYLHDFAKDLEALLDWICLQLPSDLRNEAIGCLQRGKTSQSVEVIPYEFKFRYLLHS